MKDANEMLYAMKHTVIIWILHLLGFEPLTLSLLAATFVICW